MKAVLTSLKYLLQFSILVSLTFIVLFGLATSYGANKAKATPNFIECPPPTVEEGGRCVLTQDEVLYETLKLPSKTILDCHGYELRPRQEGKDASQSGDAIPSVPVAGIFLNDVSAVTVQNCIIRNFDFGVVIVNGKGRTGNSILKNSISSLYQGVLMIETDNNLVQGNTITAKSGGSIGIMQLQDSDNNRIDANIVTSPPTGSGSLPPNPFYPGAPLSDPGNLGDGIGLYSLPQIPDFRIEDTALQFVRDPAARAERNIIENNRVAVKGLWGNDKKTTSPIGVGSYQKGAIVRNNIITEGNQYGIWNADETFFQGLDVPNEEDFYPRDTLIENNTIAANSNGIGIVARHTVNTIIRGNILESPSGSGVGITLVGPGLETTTVTRNRITGYKTSLRFRKKVFAVSGNVQADFYGSNVYLNDILDSNKQAIEIIGDYDFPTELSVNGQGNYWGRACSNDEGFREYGENNPDSPSPYVNDSHPYGEPVAGTAEEDLPMTCF